MTVLKGKRGAWLNQFAQPDAALFNARASQVGYVIIKYGLAFYEALARAAGVDWLGERMGEPVGPAAAATYAQQLADQCNQPGCVGGVINLEEADGGWHNDDGTATRLLIETFRRRAPGKPLFASLDTRGGRPDSPYQAVCAEMCDGVMPMIYPHAFGQSPARAFAAALTNLVYQRWAGKEIIPTIQTYGDITPADVAASAEICDYLYTRTRIVGANFYTLGHADVEQWAEALSFAISSGAPAPPTVDLAAALIALRKAWEDGWTAIAARGTIAEAEALAGYWRKLVS